MTATQTPVPLFGLGTENTAYAKYFVGNSWLNMLTTEGVVSANVTFEPACRNNWHIHHKGGQILFVTDGRGWYREWGKPARTEPPRTVGLPISRWNCRRTESPPNGARWSATRNTRSSRNPHRFSLFSLLDAEYGRFSTAGSVFFWRHNI